MTSQVSRRVVTEGTYPVLQLTGQLDMRSAPDVRSALLTVLASQPEALVVDVAGLTVADPAATGVLGDVARETADWPATRLALCAPGSAGQWRALGLPLWPSRDEAFTGLGAPDAGRYLSLALDPVVGAARRSRELVTEACARWDRPDLAGPACIVLTELVNNVVAHARTPMTVFLARYGDSMSVAVRDESPLTPRFSGPVSPNSYGGRGLLLIDAVSARWGKLDLAGGKVVWALLTEDEPQSPGTGQQLDRTGMADPARG
jgi:ABC-type transporter Mla MlaB component